MSKNATIKTLIEIEAKNDGSVKSELGKTSKQLDDLRKKASETSAMPNMQGGQQADEAMRQAARRAQNVTAKVNALGESVRSTGYKMQSLGTKMMPASLGAQGIITASVKMASDFDDSMASVNTIAKLSSDKLKGLSNQLLNVAKSTGKSATEISEASYQALSASVPKNQLVSFTKTAANLAKTGRTETATAVDTLTTAMNAYGKQAGSAQSIADRLIETQNAGKLTVGELSTSIGKSIGVAKNAGVSINNLLSSYVMMTKQGISTRVATTQINSMLDELANSSSSSGKALKKGTGKSFDELMKSGKSLGDVLGILNKSVKGNNEKFKGLFSNSNAKKAAMTLLNGTVKGFNDEMGRMKNSAGNVDRALKRLNTRGAKSKKAINALQVSGIELGETFMDAATPAINSVTSGIGKLTDKFDKLPQKEKNVVAGATAVVAVASPVLIGVGKIVSGLGNLIMKTASTTGKVIKFTAALKESGPGSLRAVQSLQKYIKYVKALPSATEHAAAGEHTFTAYLASSGAVAGTTIAAVAALSAVMLSQRHNFQASSKDVDNLTKKYDSAADKTDSLIASSEAQISASKKQNNAMITNGAVANDLVSKIKKLRSVENKSSLQKKELKADVLALNKVIPGLNLKYNEEKDQLSKTNEKIAENIKLLKQQSIAKAAAKNASGLTDKLGELKLQQSSNSVNLAEQKAKVDALNKKQQAALARSRKLDADPTASAADKNEAMRKLSQYTSALSKAEKSYSRLKTKQSQLNKEIANVNKHINLNSFNSAIAKARADGKKIPDALAAGMKSTMKVLPATTQELNTAVKYKTVINKAKDAGVKIPKEMSQKIVTGKITVKKAESQLNSVIRFDNATKRAKKAGVKIPKGLASGVDSGKISASKAANRVNQVIKFDKAVKKAKSQGIKIPKGLVSAVASGKLSAAKASQQLGNASTSKLDKSKDAKSKGTKTNQGFSSGVGQTAPPTAAAIRASNASVAPFRKVPNRVGSALAGLSAKIHDAFQFTPPHIKIPHFSLSGSFDLKKGTIPHLGVEWYKNGGIMTRPTVFGAAGNKLLAGGEAGPEGIIPLSKLWKNMDRAIASTVNTNVKNIYNDAGSLVESSPVSKVINVNNYNNYNNYYNSSIKNYNSESKLAKNVQSFANGNKNSKFVTLKSANTANNLKNSTTVNKISALTAKSVTNMANSAVNQAVNNSYAHKAVTSSAKVSNASIAKAITNLASNAVNSVSNKTNTAKHVDSLVNNATNAVYNKALSSDRSYKINKSNAIANSYKSLDVKNDIANSAKSIRSSVLNARSATSNAKTITNLASNAVNSVSNKSNTNTAKRVDSLVSNAITNHKAFDASNTKTIKVSNALDKSISKVSTIASLIKMSSAVSSPITKLISKKADSKMVKILDVKPGEMPRPRIGIDPSKDIKSKNLASVIKTGSLVYNPGKTAQEISSNITNNAKSRSVNTSNHSATSVSNSRTHASNKSINISGITFAPNIVIKGSAKKQDIIDALKEVEDEFKDYLKEITDDEEESYYA